MSELIIKDNALMKAELDVQITTAKAYPRDIIKAQKEAIIMATLDQETAESCIYALPRKDADGNKEYIKGESVRLAEIVASAWGNLHIGSRVIANDGKSITVEGVAWDLEKNLKVSKEVKRSILTKNKQTYSNDMQVVTGNAGQSIAYRNAVLSVVPRAFVKRIYDAAVQAAIGDQQKLGAKIKTLFERFKKLGIEPERILNYFGKKLESEITAAEVEEMIGIGTAVRDNAISIDKAFIIESEADTSKADELEEKLKGI